MGKVVNKDKQKEAEKTQMIQWNQLFFFDAFVRLFHTSSFFLFQAQSAANTTVSFVRKYMYVCVCV